ncbi:MAG TPA: cupin [Nitrospinota bacterium]|nr:cupin [Nitrospinota bacterium]
MLQGKFKDGDKIIVDADTERGEMVFGKGEIMNDFPNFMKNPLNKIAAQSQSKGIEGYVFDGIDGSQMAYWTCHKDGFSKEHVDDYDEYMIVVQELYTLIINGEKIPVKSGEEYYI